MKNDHISTLLFVVTLGRSGSNHLCSILESIDNLLMTYEPSTDWSKEVRNVPEDERKRITQNVLCEFMEKHHMIRDNKLDPNKSYILGSKLLNGHFYHFDIQADFLNDMHHNTKYIILERENVLDRYVSMNLAKKNSVWFSSTKKTNEYKDQKINLNLDQFKKFTVEHKNWIEKYKIMFPNALYLTYDEIKGEKYHNVVNNKILPYLNLSKSKLKNNVASCYKRIRSKNLEQIITNYEEVYDGIKEWI